MTLYLHHADLCMDYTVHHPAFVEGQSNANAQNSNQTFHGGWLLAILNFSVVIIITQNTQTDRQTVENTVWIAL